MAGATFRWWRTVAIAIAFASVSICNNHPEQSSILVENEFIIQFKEYRYQQDWLNYLPAIGDSDCHAQEGLAPPTDISPVVLINQSSDCSWTAVHRNSPATAYPTDFVILRFAAACLPMQVEDLRHRLLRDATIKSITPQRVLNRALLSVEASHDGTTAQQLRQRVRSTAWSKQVSRYVSG